MSGHPKCFKNRNDLGGYQTEKPFKFLIEARVISSNKVLTKLLPIKSNIQYFLI
jgi:hypothetical protein